MSFYGFAKALTYGIVRLIFNMRYEGLENVPQKQGFILACNHRSYIDPIFIAHKVKNPLNFMAKEELFANAFLGALIRPLHTFPVSRGKGDMTAINKARDIIRQGGVLCIFPEGTRSKDGAPQRPKPGVTMIAGAVGCGVLPVALSFKGKLGFRRKVTVRYGKLLAPEDLAIDPKASSTIRKAAVTVMDAIVAQLDRDCFGTYDG